jgi:hypothetical protein
MPLPESSFVAFGARKCAKPRVVWTREGVLQTEVLSDAYCIPMDYESSEFYLEQCIDLFADRYGGFGPGGAGGSGRCGKRVGGGGQVKGVGITPLVDPEADEFHRSGTMTLEEGAHEALYGEVLDALLPHGALRCNGLFLTGGRFIQNGPYGKSIPRWRACITRDFVLRPAHFLRNPDFKGDLADKQTLKRGPSFDTRRTIAAGCQLPLELQRIYAPGLSADNDLIELLNESLRCMAARFAQQVAASFALRINHGALSCSNVSIDGRLLDFGVTGYVPLFRRHARPPNWQDPLSQAQALKSTIGAIHLHLTKYVLQQRGTHGLITIPELLACFDVSYSEQLADEFIGLFGLFGSMIVSCPRSVKSKLASILVKIGMRGVKESYVHFKAHHDSTGQNESPRLAGEFNVSEVLRTVAVGIQESSLDRRLSSVIRDSALRAELQESLDCLLSWLYQQLCPIAPDEINSYLARQMLRRNCDLSYLHRSNTQSAFLEVEQSDDPEEIAALIDALVKRTVALLQRADPLLSGSTVHEQIASLRVRAC